MAQPPGGCGGGNPRCLGALAEVGDCLQLPSQAGRCPPIRELSGCFNDKVNSHCPVLIFNLLMCMKQRGNGRVVKKRNRTVKWNHSSRMGENCQEFQHCCSESTLKCSRSVGHPQAVLSSSRVAGSTQIRVVGRRRVGTAPKGPFSLIVFP